MANDRWRTRLRLWCEAPVNNFNDLTRKTVAIMILVSDNKPFNKMTDGHVKPAKVDRYVTLKGECEDDSDEIQD